MSITPHRSFLNDFRSDIQALYPESSRLRKFLACITNPSLHAALLIRCCQYSPSALFWIFRLVLQSKHAIDFGKGARIGRALRLPHPISMVIGGGSRIGSHVMIYQGVTLGKKNEGYPIVEDNVVIYPNSVIVGEVVLGHGAVVGALSFVDKSVGPGEVFRKK